MSSFQQQYQSLLSQDLKKCEDKLKDVERSMEYQRKRWNAYNSKEDSVCERGQYHCSQLQKYEFDHNKLSKVTAHNVDMDLATAHGLIIFHKEKLKSLEIQLEQGIEKAKAIMRQLNKLVGKKEELLKKKESIERDIYELGSLSYSS